jgi:hypothetical protein
MSGVLGAPKSAGAATYTNMNLMRAFVARSLVIGGLDMLAMNDNWMMSLKMGALGSAGSLASQIWLEHAILPEKSV